MTALRFILASARHYWRTHLGVVLGAALATLVLTGSLLVGDSVQATLRSQAYARIGKANVALFGGERLLHEALCPQIQEWATGHALMIRGAMAKTDGTARANSIQVIGVGGRFWDFSWTGDDFRLHNSPEEKERTGVIPLMSPSPGGVVLNERLAAQLGVVVGDSVIIRVEKPGAFSRDAPLSGEEGEIVALRLKVERIHNQWQFGNFALTASQVPPLTAFVNLRELQKSFGIEARVNLILSRLPDVEALSTRLREMVSDSQKLREHLRERRADWERQEKWAFIDARNEEEKKRLKQWDGEHLAARARWLPIDDNNFSLDASLSLQALPTGGFELRTSRVFLDPPVVAVAPQAADRRRVDALTYFVNELRAGEKATPYSMVTAVETASSGFLPAELADDEIVLSQWTADDLGVTTGGKVTLKYFTMGERRELMERERAFTVLAVLPMSEPQLNASWMPDFPGLADKQNCRDWKPGFAFDATRMRDKDQEYWEQYRGTPKAFVNLHVGQQMWGNRWGNTTSLRWPAGTDRAAIEKALREKITPEMLGFQFIPLREQALAATRAPVDFGQLFVSFSFFLIAAAAVLTGLLFVFTLEQRAAESGTLLALGLPQGLVRRMLLTEGAVLALVGSLLGALGAVIYTRLVLRGLATVWRGAVGAVEFQFSAGAWTIPIGVVSGVVIAVLAMWLASRRLLRHSATELLSGEVGQASSLPQSRELPARGVRAGMPARLRQAGMPALLLAALALACFGGASPGAFFGAGSLLLAAGLLFALAQLRRTAEGTALESLPQLGVRNAARRCGRSLATIAVLASGVFMVVAVSAFRKGAEDTTARLDSGTGGFALLGESAAPIYEDLNSAKGREAYALDDAAMKDVRVVPLRVRDGDDASCLNLNRAMQPRLLGVKPEDLDAPTTRFRLKGFASWSAALGDSRWLGSPEPSKGGGGPSTPLGSGEPSHVNGIVDVNTLQWALQKKVGDTIEYRDDRGNAFNVVVVGTVAGSMLQGNVLIAERHFTERSPNAGGYRMFLIDVPAERAAVVSQELSRALQDRGLEVTPAARRLAEFNAVENTYLSIFQVLGGLGLLLGSAGLAIVVARNVLERRREFGLLEAVGFRAGQLRHLVFGEHRWLIVAALVIGAGSALVAVWPSLAEKAGGFPLREVALLLAGLALGCVFWTWIATRIALRGSGVNALRSE